MCRFVLAGAGGVVHSELVELAEKHFGHMKGPTYDEIPLPIVPCRYTGSEMRVRDDTIPLAHIAMAIEGIYKQIRNFSKFSVIHFKVPCVKNF